MLNKPGNASAGTVRLKKTSTSGAISELTESRLRSNTGRKDLGGTLVLWTLLLTNDLSPDHPGLELTWAIVLICRVCTLGRQVYNWGDWRRTENNGLPCHLWSPLVTSVCGILLVMWWSSGVTLGEGDGWRWPWKGPR